MSHPEILVPHGIRDNSIRVALPRGRREKGGP